MGDADSQTSVAAPPRYVTCQCCHCGGGIEFDASLLELGESRVVNCPHCAIETEIGGSQKKSGERYALWHQVRAIAGNALVVTRRVMGKVQGTSKELKPSVVPSPPPPVLAPENYLFDARLIQGYLYVLSNPSMPGLVKIGMSERLVRERVAEITSATGVPQPFRIEAAFVVLIDPREAESRVHRHLAQFRLNQDREFFSLSPGHACRIVGQFLTEQGLAPMISPPRTVALARGLGSIVRAFKGLGSCLRWLVSLFTRVVAGAIKATAWVFLFGASLVALLVSDGRRRRKL